MSIAVHFNLSLDLIWLNVYFERVKLIVNTDGASRGNPGKASYGYVIKNDTGVILHEEGKKLGVKTNNFAEYTGVLEALKYIERKYGERGEIEVLVLADSQLVVRQLSGIYKIKSPNLLDLFYEIKKVEERLTNVTYKSIPRAENFIADRMANQALDRK